MDAFKLAALAIVAASLTLLVRTYRPDMALQVGLVSGLAVLLLMIGQIAGVIDAIKALAQDNGIDSAYIGTLIKIVGIAYIVQFAVQACKDAGETAIAAKVEMCGRTLIIAAVLPAVVLLTDAVATVLKA
jgi:stage III sporulation protein AD